MFRDMIGQSWLISAKIARKAGHWQTAYSAMLQAEQAKVPFSFLESAKLTKAIGEPLKALQDLENSIQLSEAPQDVIDLTHDPDKKMKAKVQCRSVRRALWHDSFF